MSKLFDLRNAIKDSLVEADLWNPDEILIGRQTDIWNDIAVAMSHSIHDSVVVIGIAEGRSSDEDLLEMDLTIPVTVFCPIQLNPGAVPEEDQWEKLVKHLHGLSFRRNHCNWTLKFRSFSDDVEVADEADAFLARQTVFTMPFSLDDDD